MFFQKCCLATQLALPKVYWQVGSSLVVCHRLKELFKCSVLIFWHFSTTFLLSLIKVHSILPLKEKVGEKSLEDLAMWLLQHHMSVLLAKSIFLMLEPCKLQRAFHLLFSVFPFSKHKKNSWYLCDTLKSHIEYRAKKVIMPRNCVSKK